MNNEILKNAKLILTFIETNDYRKLTNILKSFNSDNLEWSVNQIINAGKFDLLDNVLESLMNVNEFTEQVASIVFESTSTKERALRNVLRKYKFN